MKTLTIKQAEKLMNNYLKKYPPKIKHSVAVSKYAYQVAKKIKKKHPELDIDLKEIRIIGLLHDIGISSGKEWLHHPFESGKLLRKLGYADYAKKIETHDPTQEIAKHFKIKGDFLPKTIEEKILVYADSLHKRGEFVGFKERVRIGMKSVRRKYPELVPLFLKYNKRQKKIIKEIERLMK